MQWYRFNMFWCTMVALLCIPILSCSSDDEPVDDSVETPLEIIDASAEYIWSPSVMWIEAQPVNADEHAGHECCPKYEWRYYKLINYEINGEKYYRVIRQEFGYFYEPWIDNPYQVGTELFTDKYIRCEGERVYGLDVNTGEEVLFHDFSTWRPGGEIAIGSLPTEGGELYPERISVTDTDDWIPDTDGMMRWARINGSCDYIKYIGKVNNGYGVFGYGDVDDRDPIVPGTIIVLAYSWSRGIIYMHPDYYKIRAESDINLKFFEYQMY